MPWIRVWALVLLCGAALAGCTAENAASGTVSGGTKYQGYVDLGVGTRF